MALIAHGSTFALSVKSEVVIPEYEVEEAAEKKRKLVLEGMKIT